ncbi:DUF3617 domain-containing protein [Hydrogenophaga bisanensis]|uniref:DUF3617 domain-containing protein n=1 Tax=Hydrogenophaga bisanensis TaxID=439611 RepID=A0ABW2RBM0_9BURK|nr:hypothetical protein [Betaproteobacteria bacterium]
MRLSSRLLSLGLMALLSSVAHAQSTKPGLWEINQKVGGNPEMDKAMAEMQQQLASMPPAQRKQMEQMMAAQGVKLGQGGGMSVQVCVTPEMAAQQEVPVQKEGDCTTKVQSRSGNTMKVAFSCKNPPSSGEGTYVFRGDTGYDMKMLVKTTEGGKPVTTTMEGTGRWLGADCGKVKPITLPPGKK